MCNWHSKQKLFVIIECWQLVFKVITLKVFRSKNVTAPHSMSLQLPTSVSHSRVALALEGYDGHQEHLQQQWQRHTHGWGRQAEHHKGKRGHGDAELPFQPIGSWPAFTTVDWFKVSSFDDQSQDCLFLQRQNQDLSWCQFCPQGASMASISHFIKFWSWLWVLAARILVGPT